MNNNQPKIVKIIRLLIRNAVIMCTACIHFKILKFIYYAGIILNAFDKLLYAQTIVVI